MWSDLVDLPFILNSFFESPLTRLILCSLVKNVAQYIFWSTTFNFVFEGGYNYPLDLVKTRLQVQSSVRKSLDRSPHL